MHGWDLNCADARPIINTWYLMASDRNGRPETFTFDIMDGKSPLIIGLDLKRYAITDNLASTPCIRFERPQDSEDREFITYIEQLRIITTGCA